MQQIDIVSSLSDPWNELMLQRFFCLQFEDYQKESASLPDVREFRRLVFDCRNAELMSLGFSVQEFPEKQLYQRFGEASLSYIPVFSIWTNSDACTVFDWDARDFPMERMRKTGWEQWRQDAERYILDRYSRLSFAVADCSEDEDI